MADADPEDGLITLEPWGREVITESRQEELRTETGGDLVDRRVLADLIGLLGVQSVMRYVDMLERKATESLAAIAGSRDPAEICQRAHALRGASINLGAHMLAERLRALEFATTAPATAAEIAALREIQQRVIGALRAAIRNGEVDGTTAASVR